MMGRNSSRPNICSARLSPAAKRWRLPIASRTCSIAFASKAGLTALNTMTAA